MGQIWKGFGLPNAVGLKYILLSFRSITCIGFAAMNKRFQRIGFFILAASLSVTAADAGPIRDALKNLREKRVAGTADAGLQTATLSYAGTKRTLYFHMPDSVAGQKNVPAVFVFHGGGGDVQSVVSNSDMAVLADSLGFVAIFPKAAGNQWNDGRSVVSQGADDVGFVRAIIANSRQLMGVDLGRVFASGVSNGGMFTQRLSCDAADLFSAVAIVSANMPADYQASCNPSRSTPKVFFNGTTDPIMPWAGGEIRSLKALGMGAGGEVLSHDQTVAFWVGQDGCTSNSKSRSLPDLTNDGTTVVLSTFSNCKGSTVLAFFEITGGGHSWPGSDGKSRRVTGTVSQDISASEEMLKFFQEYGL